MIWYLSPLARPHPLGASSTLSCQRRQAMLSGPVLPPSPDTARGLVRDLPQAILWKGSIAMCLQRLTCLKENMSALSKVEFAMFVYQAITFFYYCFVCQPEEPGNRQKNTLFQIFFPLPVRFSEPCRGKHTWLHSSSMCLCPSDLTARH